MGCGRDQCLATGVWKSLDGGICGGCGVACQLGVRAFPPTPAFALSPDGRKLVFAAVTADGKNQLWLRSLDSTAAQPLAGTENGLAPFWSPDGKSIGFFAASSLKRVESGGGSARTLTSVAAVVQPGGAWDRDGVILFSPGTGSPLLRISADGGATSTVTSLGAGEVRHAMPWFLPDSRHFLFWAVDSSSSHGTIRVGSLDAADSVAVTEADSMAVFAGGVFAGGHILFVRASTLMAQPFDPKTLKLTGAAVPVAGQVRNSPFYAAFSASANGELVYSTGAEAAINSRGLTAEPRAAKPDGPGLWESRGRCGTLSFRPTPGG